MSTFAEMRAHEYSERAMHIARGMFCRTGEDRALDVDVIVRLANAASLALMLDMKPAQLRAMADSIEAEIMGDTADGRHADALARSVALRCAANVPKRRRALYLTAFLGV